MSRVTDDSTDSISPGSPAKLDNLPTGGVGFSVTMWFMRTADGTASGTFPRLIDKRDITGADGWSLSASKTTASVASCFSYNEVHATTNKSVVSVANVFTTNVWEFVALTVAAGNTATNVHIYVAVAGGALTEVGYGTQTDSVGTYNSDAVRNLAVGRCDNDAAGSVFFTGRFAEVKIFGNKILTRNEAQGLMNGLQCPSPTAYYPLYGSASPEPDLSATASNVNLVNSPAQASHAPTSVPWIFV